MIGGQLLQPCIKPANDLLRQWSNVEELAILRGREERTRAVNCLLERWKSLDSALAIRLSLPGNHWLYSRISWSMNQVAWEHAACSFDRRCWALSSLSAKLDLRSQPADVVLLVREIEQECGGNSSAKMSIHGPMMEATCSSIFMLAWRCKWRGIAQRHAFPLSLYPPRPTGHALEKNACVGWRNVMRLILMPWCVLWRYFWRRS